MTRRSDEMLNRGLVRVACALSNTDFKDPDAYCGREFVRARFTQITSIGKGKSHKITAWLAQLALDAFTLRGIN